ncbi:hypothetical protein [Virgibacillus sp. DJP39]|uniref:hypothetical protein n=1 Tax=Virgibacillus sp. DJP39 TaxID=3409790 RepID=UPI003BB49333
MSNSTKDVANLLGISESEVKEVEKCYKERVVFKHKKFYELDKETLEFHFDNAKECGYL